MLISAPPLHAARFHRPREEVGKMLVHAFHLGDHDAQVRHGAAMVLLDMAADGGPVVVAGRVVITVKMSRNGPVIGAEIVSP